MLYPSHEIVFQIITPFQTNLVNKIPNTLFPSIMCATNIREHVIVAWCINQLQIFSDMHNWFVDRLQVIKASSFIPSRDILPILTFSLCPFFDKQILPFLLKYPWAVLHLKARDLLTDRDQGVSRHPPLGCQHKLVLVHTAQPHGQLGWLWDQNNPHAPKPYAAPCSKTDPNGFRLPNWGTMHPCAPRSSIPPDQCPRNHIHPSNLSWKWRRENWLCPSDARTFRIVDCSMHHRDLPPFLADSNGG